MKEKCPENCPNRNDDGFICPINIISSLVNIAVRPEAIERFFFQIKNKDFVGCEFNLLGISQLYLEQFFQPFKLNISRLCGKRFEFDAISIVEYFDFYYETRLLLGNKSDTALEDIIKAVESKQSFGISVPPELLEVLGLSN